MGEQERGGEGVDLHADERRKVRGKVGEERKTGEEEGVEGGTRGGAEEAVWCVFLNETATTEIYTLSRHDALPIWGSSEIWGCRVRTGRLCTPSWCSAGA